MPPLFAVMPFDVDRNFGRACNEAIALLPAGAWAAILDHDAMFTTPHWFAQMQEAIAFRPDAGAFAVVTNRIASPWQKAPEGVDAGDDVIRHRKIGEARRSCRTLLDITCTKGFGGVVTLVSRDAWEEAGGYADGLYCVDHSLFFRTVAKGRRVYLIEGLYVYHVRASSSARPPAPGAKWADCPCRGPETMPRERITLPAPC